MSRQIMCVKNLKKLGDVVGISSRGRNGYKCCSLKIVSLGHVHNKRKNEKTEFFLSESKYEDCHISTK